MFNQLVRNGLLIFTYLVLLAHAVIPHHHHHQEICVDSNHCQENSVSGPHKPVEHNHDHDGDASSDCQLRQSILLPPAHGRNYNGFIPSADHDIISSAILADHPTCPVCLNELIISVGTEISPHYAFLHTSSVGLRAPPAV